MIVERVAEIGLDPAAHAVEHVAHEVPGDAADQGGAHKQQGVPPHLRQRRRAPEGVDAALEEAGPEDGEEVGQQDHGHADGERASVRPQEGQQRPQLAHRAAMSTHRGAPASHVSVEE
jgi:hypothetical protein